MLISFDPYMIYVSKKKSHVKANIPYFEDGMGEQTAP